VTFYYLSLGKRLKRKELDFVTDKLTNSIESITSDLLSLQILHSFIKGLISLEIKNDHVYMYLVESTLFSKGKSKIYSGLPGNLVAFACKLSFQKGL
jgi:hypothetical protein